MEIFDGFISAIASEFKIPFHKDKTGNYNSTIEFDNGRSQDVNIKLGRDESGDRIIKCQSVVMGLKNLTPDFYRQCLELNFGLDYGALAIQDNALVMQNSTLLENCEPRIFIKSLIYLAAKADEFEEMLIKDDLN